MNDQTDQELQAKAPTDCTFNPGDSNADELSESELENVSGGKQEGGLIEPDWKPLPPSNPGRLINPFQK